MTGRLFLEQRLMAENDEDIPKHRIIEGGEESVPNIFLSDKIERRCALL